MLTDADWENLEREEDEEPTQQIWSKPFHADEGESVTGSSNPAQSLSPGPARSSGTPSEFVGVGGSATPPPEPAATVLTGPTRAGGPASAPAVEHSPGLAKTAGIAMGPPPPSSSTSGGRPSSEAASGRKRGRDDETPSRMPLPKLPRDLRSSR